MRRSEFKTLVTIGIIGAILAASIYGGFIDFTPSTVSATDDEELDTTTTVTIENPYNLPDGMSIDSASYIIFKNGTLTCAKNGTTGYTEFAGTNASAILSTAISNAHGLIIIKPGTYTLASSISLSSNVMIHGSGVNNTVLHSDAMVNIAISGVNHISVADLQLTGSIRMLVGENGDVDDLVLSNIWANKMTSDQRAVIDITPGVNTVVQNALIERVVITDAGTYPFMSTGDGVKRNITYSYCKALNAGISSQYNEWLVGFDVREYGTCENVTYSHCIANGNYESGFHTELSDYLGSVTLVNCEAHNNGQKTGATFGHGIMAAGGTNVINCMTGGNAKAGVYALNNLDKPVMISSCKDHGSKYGYHLQGDNITLTDSIAYQASYRGLYISDSVGHIFVTGFQSIGCLRGLYVAASSHVYVEMTDIGSTDTTQATFGGSSYYVENSTLNIYLISSVSTDVALGIAAKNCTISGFVDTNCTTAISIGGAYDVIISDMQIKLRGAAITGISGGSSEFSRVTISDTLIENTSADSAVYTIRSSSASYKFYIGDGCQVSGGFTNEEFTNVLFLTSWQSYVDITAGQTYATVTPEIVGPPLAINVQVTPRSDLNGADFWVGYFSDTSFRVYISDAQDGTITFNVLVVV